MDRGRTRSREQMQGILRIVLCVLVSACLSWAGARESRPTIVIGLVDTFDPHFYVKTFSSTIDYLEEQLPQYRIQAVDIDWRNIDEGIRRHRPQYLLLSGSDYVSLIDRYGVQQLVTRKQNGARDVNQSVSSTIIALNRPGAPGTLAELKDRTVAVTQKGSFDGWLIASGEIAAAGYDPEHFFSRVLETNYGIPDVLTLVKTGGADAGVLATCEYERMVQAGRIAPDEIRIIAKKDTGSVGCIRSTQLYPDALIAALPEASAGMNKTVLTVLLSMPAAQYGFEWDIGNSNASVLVLMRTLKLGPYLSLRETSPKALFMRYRNEVFLGLALMAAILLHIVALNILVRRRTRELVRTQREKEALNEEAKAAERKVAELERVTLVAQLSNIFAHEIKQPVTGILYNASALRLLLKNKGVNDPLAMKISDSLVEQANRCADIVERVRSYARKRVRADGSCCLRSVIDEAVRASAKREAVTVVASDGQCVQGDATELMLLVANLIRNGLQAAQTAKRPAVRVEVLEQGEEYVVCVTDNGPVIADDVFEKIGRAGFTSKTDGLGFGLSIAQAIAERHGGHLEFRRNMAGGLTVLLHLKRFEGCAGGAHAEQSGSYRR